MRLSVVLEQRFLRTPDGRVWTADGFPASFWQRYLRVFESVRIVARVCDIPAPGDQLSPVTVPGIEFTPLPYYVGPLQFVGKWRAVYRALVQVVIDDDALLFRVPSTAANVILPTLLKQGRPFALEVVCDPDIVFSKGAVLDPLRILWRAWFKWHLQQQCRRAMAVSYVTERVLQEKYPPHLYHINASDIDLHSKQPRPITTSYPSILPVPQNTSRSVDVGSVTTFRILSIGSMDQMYKGFDVLIRATAILSSYGLCVETVLVGDGRHRPALETLCRSLGIQDKVLFRGKLPYGPVLFATMRSADLFVLASRAEGLPRVIIEAMHCGLPCVATDIGGVSELVDSDVLVRPGHSLELVAKIHSVIRSPELRRRLAGRNLAQATVYSESKIAPRRDDFYQRIRSITKEWLTSTTSIHNGFKTPPSDGGHRI